MNNKIAKELTGLTLIGTLYSCGTEGGSPLTDNTPKTNKPTINITKPKETLSLEDGINILKEKFGEENVYINPKFNNNTNNNSKDTNNTNSITNNSDNTKTYFNNSLYHSPLKTKTN